MRPCLLVIALLVSSVATASSKRAAPATDLPVSNRPPALSPAPSAARAAFREDLIQVRKRLELERSIIMPGLWGGLFCGAGAGAFLMGAFSNYDAARAITFGMGSVFVAMGVTAFVSLLSIEGEYAARIRATDRELRLLTQPPGGGAVVLRF